MDLASVEDLAREHHQEYLKEERLPKVVILRILSYLSLTELIEKVLPLSNRWRRLLCEEDLAKKMLKWT